MCNSLLTFFIGNQASGEHIDLVQEEQAHYQDCCKTSTVNFKAVIPQPGFSLPTKSMNTTLHYSFWYGSAIKKIMINTANL